MRPRVLVFCDFYLPGFKSGGGMRTVANLVDRFSDRYAFHIVTRNYDSKGDKKPYDTVTTAEWNTVGPARVFYCPKLYLTPSRVAALVQEVGPDLVLLNSAFSMPARQFLRARKAAKTASVPVVLAPCGEMSGGALSVKPIKKALFLKFALSTGLYDGVIWKASSGSEAKEIRTQIGTDPEIIVAPDLTPREILPHYDPTARPLKTSGKARVAFMSRIVPNKNLKLLLQCLMKVRGELLLDLIGPVEDSAYWAECQRVIERLPGNIRVTRLGALPHDEALDRLGGNHFFVLPSLSENFGYALIEALAAGCPLIISDRTAWNDIEPAGAGWCIPLDKPDELTARLESCIRADADSYHAMSARARAYAVKWLAGEAGERQNAHLLEVARRHSPYAPAAFGA